ncbi:M48 family metalloprotease [Streptomyces sp. NPDC021093]|uniref:M48 family metalloprotease n=1 Tax=Streptomyces sp. NPDC021093 TaxID=3365112 RepID=UPI0037B3597D
MAAAITLNAVFFAAFMSRVEAQDCTGLPGCDNTSALFVAAVRNLTWPLLAGVAVYGGVARWRRRRTRKLWGTPFAELDGVITRIAFQVRVPRIPAIRLGPRLGPRAYVVGPPKDPQLVLGPEILALHHKGEEARRAFAAVMRHELAHVKANDLWSHYIMMVLRAQNVAIGAFFLVALAVSDSSAHESMVVTIRMVALVLIAELVSRAFLRAREHAADARSTAYDAAAMGAALRDGPCTPGPPGRHMKWLLRHPSSSERRAALLDPDVLLSSSAGHVLLAGALAGIALSTIQDLLLRWADPQSSPDTPIAAGLIFGVPLSLFMAFQVWPLSKQGGWFPRRLLQVGTALFTGLVGGSYAAASTRLGGVEATGIPLRASTLLATAASAVLLCGWLLVVAASWRRWHPVSGNLRPALWLGAPAACIVGSWLVALSWTWAMRLRAVDLGCVGDAAREHPVCLSSTPELDVTRSVGETFGPGPALVIVIVAAALPLLLAATVAVLPARARVRK